jgi:putative endopeptidase
MVYRARRGIVLALCLLTLLTPLVGPVSAHAALEAANMDLSADPAEDFYRYVNGGWQDRTEIPADRGSYGVFDELYDRTRDQLLSILDDPDAAATLEPGSDQWKAVQLYQQGLDLETRNVQGIEPIQPLLDDIAGITTLDDVHAFQQGAAFDLLNGLFSFYVAPDLLDSSVNVPYLGGPYFGLPNRDYYVDEDPELRDAYIGTSAELLIHAGYDPDTAQEAAAAVYELEYALADATLPREDAQDFAVIYNPMSLDELKTLYPAMDWDAWVAELGFEGIETFVVDDVAYFEALPGILAETPIEVLQAYYILEVMWSASSLLSEEIEATAFAFEGPVMSGVSEQSPLEERSLDTVNSIVPDAIGRLYVAEHFPPEAKAEIEALVDAEIDAFRIRLENNPWMSEETRAGALAKLDSMMVKVGYPDEWDDYEALQIGDSYAASVMSAGEASVRESLAEAGQPVDRSAWDMPVQRVNAYYNPLNNEIVFPAAILQAPFFEYGGDPAANFGGIGMVIGHELTHGFDVSGSQFDAEGNLVNWWAEEDFATFDALNHRLVDQYNAIEVLPGVTINGQLTVGENAADLGGTQIAYDAFMLSLAREGEASGTATPSATPFASPVMPAGMDALTPQQRFFVSVATVWRFKSRDEALRTQVMIDPHSPGTVRAVVPIRNMDAFHDAFDVQPGDPMYLPPEDRVVIW